MSEDVFLTAAPPPPAEPAPVNDAPIKVAIPDDVTVKVTEINQPLAVAQAQAEAQAPRLQETAQQRADREHRDMLEQRKAQFVKAVLDARKPETPAIVPQPVHPAISERTRLEMEMGAKMNAHWEAVKAARPVVVPSAKERAAQGGSTAVFRPADYVPDPVKGSGNIQGRNLSNA